MPEKSNPEKSESGNLADYARKRLGSGLRQASTGRKSIHPALIPGISVEQRSYSYPTNYPVFIVALALMLIVGVWAVIAPESLQSTGLGMRSWVVDHFGWFFSVLAILTTLFMLVIALGPTGKIRLGPDDSEPEFSTISWISMLFAAGLGIGLVFLGPLEPLRYFLNPSPIVDAEPGTTEAILPAMAQVILEQASFAWGIYAFLGGALAYSAYRRGRLPLISALFEPVFPDGSHRVLGKIIDIAAIMVTLFGTATSLGLGALQLRAGASIVTGIDMSGNSWIVIGASIMTCLFIISAVSGVKRGIRLLSNINMGLVIALSVFVGIAGPTFFLLDLFPTGIYAFFDTVLEMFTVSPSQGPVEQEFVTYGVMLYWAWWISYAPFVGMFIAKISKGRTIRQFSLVVIIVPSLISAGWYTIFGGSAIWMNREGMDVNIEASGENVMFDILANLPLSMVTSVIVLFAIIIFFVTAGDSATIVMGSMSQTGRGIPSMPVTIIWGLGTGFIAIFLLLAGGDDALSGVQSVMVSFSIVFAVILFALMFVWAADLRRDPLIIRNYYARQAIARGVQEGIDEHGDDFVFGVSKVEGHKGAGAEFKSDDPNLTKWYTDAAEEIGDQEPSAETDDK